MSRGRVRDIRPTIWYRFVEEIGALLATGRFTWAEETLTGIRATVEQQHRVTPAQRLAVEHIAAGRRLGRSRR